MTKSYVSEKATIGKNVTIEPFTIVHDNVDVGDNTIIESHCVIGKPIDRAEGKKLFIGANSHVRSHSVLYVGSSYGPGLTTGHHAFARENIVAGAGFQIGTKSVVAGDSRFGMYVKIHTMALIGEDAEVGDFVYFLPYVQLLNDPFPPSPIRSGVTVKDMAVVAAAAVIYPGVRLGTGSFVAAGSHVNCDVADTNCVSGSPARPFSTLDKFVHRQYGPYHPWLKRHFAKYPTEAHPFIAEHLTKLDRLIAALRVQRNP